MFNHFTDVIAAASLWAYLIIAVFSMLDAVLPIIPSETAVITAGVAAATAGALSLPVVIGCAAVGAFAGDNCGYLLGWRFGDWAQQRFLSGETGARRLAWAQRQLDRRGGELIIAGRFIPGGRTAVTLTAGLTRFPWRRFAFFDVIAALLWANYAALLGYLGGTAFRADPWKGLALAFGIALAVTGTIEAARAVRRHRQRRALDHELDPSMTRRVGAEGGGSGAR